MSFERTKLSRELTHALLDVYQQEERRQDQPPDTHLLNSLYQLVQAWGTRGECGAEIRVAGVRIPCGNGERHPGSHHGSNGGVSVSWTDADLLHLAELLAQP